MDRLLRVDLEFIEMASAGVVLRDPVSGDRYRLGTEERQLMRWLDEGIGSDDIRRRYRESFGQPLRRRHIREFVQQLADAGLLESTHGSADGGRSAFSVGDRATISAPPPDAVGAGDVNRRFDALAAVLGWALHPVCLVPLLAACLLAASGLVQGLDRCLAELSGLWDRHPLGVVILITVERTLFLTLPRELMVGMACRRFGGWIRSLRLNLVGNLLPTFACDIGDSVAFLRGRGKWTLLTIRFWCHLAIGSAAVLGWVMTEPGSVPGTGWLLLILPATVGACLHLNIFMPLDGYAVLIRVLKVKDLRRRALAETGAWLRFRRAPEPLTGGERFWIRVYGLGVYCWRAFAYCLVIGVLGWMLIPRFDGLGTLILAALVIRWHQESIGNMVMKNDSLRWMIRGGGRWWLRWSLRLILLAALVACGFIPYNNELSGECRLGPVAERGIRAEIAGPIEDVHADEGEWVEQGALIATLVARVERADVAMTEAALARAKADHARLVAGARPEEITMAAEEVELRKIQLRLFETELARITEMYQSEAASEIERSRAQDARDAAEQAWLIAKEKLALLQKGTRDEEIEAAAADVARLEAQLAHHKEMLALREIRAPISGRVVTAHLGQRRGQYVEPGDLIAVLQDDSQVRVEVALEEESVLQIKPGQAVKIRLWGTDGGLLNGRVQRVSSRVEDYAELNIDPIRSDREGRLEESLQREEERFIRVFVELDEDPERTLPGMTGSARIVVSQDVLWRAVLRPVSRFFRVEVWSWLP